MKDQFAEDKMTKSQLFLLSIVSLLVIVMPLGDAGGLITVCLAVGGLVAFFNKDAMKACRWVLIIWGVYSLLYGLSALWSVVPQMVIADLRKENLYTFFAFALSFTAFYKAKEKSKDFFIFTILFGGIVLSAMQVIESLGIQIEVLENFTEKQYPGVGDTSTLFVLFFATSFYLFLTKNRLRICVGLLYQALILYTTFLTQNRMAFICFSLIYVVYFLVIMWRLSSTKRVGFLLVLVPLSCALFFFSFSLKTNQHKTMLEQVEFVSTHDSRIYVWDFYLHKALEKPMLGYGGGYGMSTETFKSEFPDKFSHYVKLHAHNVLLNKLLQMGIVGLLLFALLYGFAFKKSVFPFKKDQITLVALLVFVGYFAKSMTDDFFIRNSLLLFWILIGFFMNANRSEESK